MDWKGSVIVTGGTANLGYHAALEIAKLHPEYLVVLSSRSDKDNAAEAINKALGQHNTLFMGVDLSNLSDVRRYAKEWASRNYAPIRSLVLNAGLQFPGALNMTVDKLESTFGVNHVGHALLFHLLCPHLADTARIVLTSSGTHDPAQKSGLPDAVYTTAEDLAHPPPNMVDVPGRQRYASSKLANVLWAYALERRLREQAPRRTITVNAFDPGLMPGTGLAREASCIERTLWLHVLPRTMPLLRMLISPNIHTPRESGLALARLAVGKDTATVNGEYFEGMKAIPSSKDSYVQEKQDDLWEWTIRYLASDESEVRKFQELA